MNLRQLGYFLKIAELKNFTHAANALFVSQPALSRQIRQLEEELGITLFIRSERGVKLTEAGELLKRRSPAILNDIAQLRNELQSAYGADPSGQLTVGMGMSVRDLLTIPLLSAYQSRFPSVGLRIREGVTNSLVEDVKIGLIDCALVFELAPYEHLVEEPFVREPLLLVSPRSSDLSMDSAVSIERAFSLPLAVTSGDSPLRRITEAAAKESQVRLNISYESNAVDVMIQSVIDGDFHAVLPYSAVSCALNCGQVKAAPIEGLSLPWTFVFARSLGLSLPARAYRDLLFAHAASLLSEGVWPLASALFARPEARPS